MADNTELNVTCHCKAHKHTFSIPTSLLPFKAYFCHCDSCRHVTGAPAANYFTIPQEVSQPDLKDLIKYKTSEGTGRYFCGSCGTHLYVKDEGSNDICVAGGVTDKAEGIYEVVGHEFVADTKDGGISEFLPKIGNRQMCRAAAWPGKSEELPLGWTASDRGSAEMPEDRKDTIQAHCHCKGVAITVRRPSDGVEDFDPHKEPFWRPRKGKYLANLCACESCRLSFGQEPISWAFVPCVDMFKPDGAPFERYYGTMKTWRSSSDVTRVFCGTCGATIFWDGDDRQPFLVDLALGLLASPSGVRAEEWLIWRTHRMSFDEDALDKKCIEGFKVGIKAWGEKKANA